MERKILKCFEICEKLRFCVLDSNQSHILIQIKLNRGKPKVFEHFDSNQNLHLIRIKHFLVTFGWFDSNQTLHLIRIRKFSNIFQLALLELIRIIINSSFESHGSLIQIRPCSWFESIEEWVKTRFFFYSISLVLWLKSWIALDSNMTNFSTIFCA